ncbi:hypothetical protein HYW21_04650 [Candidatus Woesearchaeota archaeon]|nr:hypothetical protein [Candidatus Woesearchaeota archaeon]
MADISDLTGGIPALEAFAEQAMSMHDAAIATARTSRVDMSVYPDIVQELGSLADRVTGEVPGYVLGRKTGRWDVDTTKRTLTFHPLHERGIENAPVYIQGIFYGAAGVLHLLPRASIIAALRAEFEREHPFRPEDHYSGLLALRESLHDTQVYGIEISLQEDHELGRAFALAIEQSPLRDQLLERTTVANSVPREYGFERKILYVPVTEAERQDVILL